MKTTRNREFAKIGKRAVIALACTALVACYSFQPIEGTQPEVQHQLRSGTAVKVGDELKIRTTSGDNYRFRVVAIDQQSVRGNTKEIKIDDIVALQRGHFDTTKTVLLVGGVALLMVGAVAATADFAPSGAFSY